MGVTEKLLENFFKYQMQNGPEGLNQSVPPQANPGYGQQMGLQQSDLGAIQQIMNQERNQSVVSSFGQPNLAMDITPRIRLLEEMNRKEQVREAWKQVNPEQYASPSYDERFLDNKIAYDELMNALQTRM